ncbi:hypothetical protein Franean1_2805 [Parafrankia sp. EAN1pec]|nr:hypothetical protein Franean1_2805 [Frankia sp. EAN1pec]
MWVTAEDKAGATESDWAAIVEHAHRYCWKADASRSRKRGSDGYRRAGTVTVTGHILMALDTWDSYPKEPRREQERVEFTLRKRLHGRRIKPTVLAAN